jgi:hypothetical protein
MNEELIRFITVKVLQKDIDFANENPEYQENPLHIALRRLTGRIYSLDRLAKRAWCHDDNALKFLFNDDVTDFLNKWDDNDNVVPINCVFIVEDDIKIQEQVENE